MGRSIKISDLVWPERLRIWQQSSDAQQSAPNSDNTLVSPSGALFLNRVSRAQAAFAISVTYKDLAAYAFTYLNQR